ncbi:MAG: hypothetical protein AAF628_09890 [Planctomycetota bacterium]
MRSSILQTALLTSMLVASSTTLPGQIISLGKTVSGSAGRTIGGWIAGADQRSDAYASYGYTATSNTGSTFTNDIDFLNHSIEAIHYDLDLVGSVFASPFGGSTFTSRYGGQQSTSAVFQSDRTFALSRPLTFVPLAAVRTNVFAGWTQVLLEGHLTVTTDLDVDATVRLGIPNRVHQSGFMSGSARGQVYIVEAETPSTLGFELDYGTNTLNVNLGASSSRWGQGPGSLTGVATHTLGSYRLFLKVCSQFGLPTSLICRTYVDQKSIFGIIQTLVRVL